MMRTRIAALTLAIAAAAPAAATAQELVSLQAQAVGGGWSLPAPGQRSAVCLVDSGVDRSEIDVPADLRGTAVQGISGSAPATGADGQPVLHGTWMSQVASAPADGRGMIGSSPGVPVIMVRAMREGVGSFTGGDYAAGMLQCEREARAAGWRLASIALALGGEGATSADRESIAQRVEFLDAVPVAANGNRRGVPQFPASAPGVLGVTAVSAVDGAACPDAADGDPEAGGLVGPGCYVTMPIDGVARPVRSAGTSGASVVVAAAIAQVCDVLPSLTPRECLAVVQATTRPVPGGRLPDLRAAVASRGLTAPALTAPLATLITPGTLSIPVTTPDEAIVQAPIAPRWYGLKRRPQVKRVRGGRVTITSPDKHRAARIWTSLRGAKVGKYRTVTGRPRGSKVKIRVTQVVAGRSYQRQWTIKVPRR